MSTANVRTFQFSLNSGKLLTKDRFETSIEGIVTYEGDVEQETLLQSLTNTARGYIEKHNIMELIHVINTEKIQEFNAHVTSQLNDMSIKVKDFIVKTIDAKSNPDIPVETESNTHVEKKKKKRFFGLF